LTGFLRHLLHQDNRFLNDPHRDTHGLVDGTLLLCLESLGGERMADWAAKTERGPSLICDSTPRDADR
jgi:hypothetical protein